MRADLKSSTNFSGVDKFGIKKIYATKELGREWFLNMDNPFDDDFFSSTFDKNITRQPDGGWKITSPAVRLNVNTPPGLPAWKNVEITGYAKIVSVLPYNNLTIDDADLSWYARGGRHNVNVPCEATAYFGGIYASGSIAWKKSIWFVGGYTDGRAVQKITDPLIGRWIGWKIVMYNINKDAVKLESFIDNTKTNYWVQVTDVVDDGGWYAKSDDNTFFGAGCDRDKDYVITNGGPIATFRSDNIIWEFKDLSIREIDPEMRINLIR